jgi:REP element-mobilizing transposase RayT
MRKNLRLRGYDYSTNNVYFVTICAHRRQPRFIGCVREIAERELLVLPIRFGGLTLDCWKLQPDHVHAILALCDCRASLSAIVQAYKSIATREIKQITAIDRVWQRGFYDRIVRSESELEDLREYVAHNDVIHAARAAGLV